VTTSTILVTDVTVPVADTSPGHISAHLNALRHIAGEFGGHVTKTVSDGVIATFDSAYDAVRAAIAMQQSIHRRAAVDPDCPRARVGINVGDVSRDGAGGDVLGTEVMVARRLCETAAPGQILVSGVVEHLLRRRDDIVFRSAGEIEVAGVSEPEPAFDVGWEPLPERAAPRVVVADDAGLLRAGIVNVLLSAGFDVIAEAGDYDELIEVATRHQPALLITDIRMPPSNTDEGVRAAIALRAAQPSLAVLVLSQYVDAQAAIALLDSEGAGVGYLLKERVTEVAEFIDAAHQVLAGTPVIDATVAQRMMARRSVDHALTRLSAREREVLSQMATGASNRAIAESLVVAAKTVETHVSSILTKLDLPEMGDGNRRVQAVLRFLEATR
jgi:DNA-binding NarL/FixJ family response regulator